MDSYKASSNIPLQRKKQTSKLQLDFQKALTLPLHLTRFLRVHQQDNSSLPKHSPQPFYTIVLPFPLFPAPLQALLHPIFQSQPSKRSSLIPYIRDNLPWSTSCHVHQIQSGIQKDFINKPHREMTSPAHLPAPHCGITPQNHPCSVY